MPLHCLRALILAENSMGLPALGDLLEPLQADLALVFAEQKQPNGLLQHVAHAWLSACPSEGLQLLSWTSGRGWVSPSAAYSSPSLWGGWSRVFPGRWGMD